MRRDVFLDTAHAIALANERDEYHVEALRRSKEISREQRRIVTTEPVLVEIGNRLAAPPNREATARYIETLRREDAVVDVVPQTSALLEQGLALYKSRPDKEWGLTDCISFVVMRERGITDALTIDHHFEQAGINVLLRT
jgi:predicted nucleic acid-binding protein